MYDLVIKNGKLVTPDRIYEADVAITDGKYAAFLAPGTEVEAKELIEMCIRDSFYIVHDSLVLCHSYAVLIVISKLLVLSDQT